ncbi:MAG TPA: zf-TFIIB domain-containing protein [Candidatus Hydrogenedentes bacterium]|nr:zf-TFIIB domain-containing protein [Candidatus Hydrogenedentota bacterium]
MNCPSCDEPLITCEYENVEVDWCSACGGVWLDAGEFELLESIHGVTPLPAVPLHQASSRRCPVCGGSMQLTRRVLSGDSGSVTVDRCPSGHGEWYDAGELESLLRMPGTITGSAMDPLSRLFGRPGSSDPV